MNSNETITAIATAPGTGAIAMIRVSGPESISLIARHFTKGPDRIHAGFFEHSKAVFGKLTANEEIIDEVVVTCFHAPASYTGEDLVEVSCHGSLYIQERILQLFVGSGARLAEPGEFTLRAFLNGKMDLSQAEGVADLIASQNRSQHHLAMQQMRGGVSSKLSVQREKLVNFAALLELELDFSQEDVEFADRTALMDLLHEVSEEINRLRNSFRIGNAIKRGIPVAIAGRPNAGKSTLLNALLEEEKAIVSEIPGTTRDAIEDTVIIGEVPFRFIDTAGLRDNPDSIEAIGIERTLDRITRAAVVFYVFDATTTSIDEIKEELADLSLRLKAQNENPSADEKQFILVANKIDQLTEIPHHFTDYLEMEVVFISAKRHENLEMLTTALLKTVDTDQLRDQLVITNMRHYEALTHTSEALRDASDALVAQIPADLIAVDIRKALYHIGVITGEVTNQELLGNIFGKFCIGK